MKMSCECSYSRRMDILLTKWCSDKGIRFPHQQRRDKTGGERIAVKKEKYRKKSNMKRDR